MSRLSVGIDWATEVHHACVMDAAGVVRAQFAFSHDPEGLEKLFQRVRTLESLERAVFVLERSEGLLVDALVGRSLEVWYINPKQAHRFRERYTLAGAKDDRRDAWVLANAARTDSELFRRIRARPRLLLRLRGAERRHTELTDERVRLVAKARAATAEYYPAFLKVSNDFDRDWVRELWRLAPTPSAGRQVRRHRVERLLREHHVRATHADEVLSVLRDDALVAAEGSVEAAEPLVAALLDTLDAVVAHERLADRDIDAALEEIEAGGVLEAAPTAPDPTPTAPDPTLDPTLDPSGGVAPPGSTTAPADWAFIATAVRSLPGVGGKIRGVIMGEAPEALRGAHYLELRAMAGAAPVTDTTGKQWRSKRPKVKMRNACNERLRNAMHMWGMRAAAVDPYWGAYRARLLARGHSPARANRQLADRLLAILCALVRTRTTYDPTRFRLVTEAA